MTDNYTTEPGANTGGHLAKIDVYTVGSCGNRADRRSATAYIYLLCLTTCRMARSRATFAFPPRQGGFVARARTDMAELKPGCHELESRFYHMAQGYKALRSATDNRPPPSDGCVASPPNPGPLWEAFRQVARGVPNPWTHFLAEPECSTLEYNPPEMLVDEQA